MSGVTIQRSVAINRADSDQLIDVGLPRPADDEWPAEASGSEISAESRPPRGSIAILSQWRADGSERSLSTHRERQWGADHWALNAHLSGLPCSDGDQAELELRYIEAMAQALTDRTAELGEGFALAEPMPSQAGAGAWAALYEACSGAVGSMARSPVRNAIGVELNGSAEITLSFYQALISGAVGGVTAYMAAEWLIKGADRQAKKYNFKEIVPIDVKKVLPYPCKIELTVEDGTKTYRLLDDDEVAQGRAAVDRQRAALAAVQARLAGNGEFSPYVQGLLTGALNVIRRIGPAADLFDPGRVFGTSALASGAGGFLAKGLFGVLKLSSLAHANVDDLVGGLQQINLFKVRGRDLDSDRNAQWCDVASFATDTFVEFGALGFHRLNCCADGSFGEELKDILSHALMNSIASVGSVGFGLTAATAVRGPEQFGPRVGEAQDSLGFMVQQFFQSTTNDYLWNAAKKLTGSPVSNLAATLDSQRARAARRALLEQADGNAVV